MADTKVTFDILAKDRASRVFTNVGREAGKTNSILGGLGRGAAKLGKLAGVGAVALGGLGVAGAMMGISVSAGNEQARISFTTMLGSAKRADKFLRRLQAFAAKTPFEFPELQTAASSLISAGFQAKKVIPIMTTLGDVTSGMGTGAEGVKRATVALQQMSAAGRITGEDLNQLRDAGVPVFTLLSAATGKSKEAIAQLAQQGKLGKTEMEALFKALETGKGLKQFNGLMEKQSESLKGLWSTLKDTVSQGLGKIMDRYRPQIKELLKGAIDLADSLSKKIPQAIDKVVPKIKDMGTFISTEVVPPIKDLVTWVRSELAPALNEFSTTVAPEANGALQALSDSVKSVNHAFDTGADKPRDYGNSVTDMISLLGPFAAGMFKQFAANVKVLTVAFQVSTFAVRSFARIGASLIVNFSDVFLGAVSGIARGAASLADALGMDNLAKKLRGAADKVDMFKATVRGKLEELEGITNDAGYRAGESLGQGLAAGIAASSGMAIEQARQTANKINSMMRSAKGFDSHSPSRKGKKMGGELIEGVALGMKNATVAVLDAAQKLTDRLLGKMQSGLDKAKSKLADMKSTAAGFASTASGAITGAIDLGFGAQDAVEGTKDTPGTAAIAADPVGYMAGIAAKAQAFVATMGSLIAKGIPAALVTSVAALGPIGGATAASALAGLDAGGVASLRASQSSIDASAAASGKLIANLNVPPAMIKAQADRVTEAKAQTKLLQRMADRLDKLDKNDEVELKVKGDDLYVLIKRVEKKKERRA